MRASTVTLPLLALLATGCERMPEDPVFMYGEVKHADGSPAGSTPLRVDRALDTANDLLAVEGRVWNYEPYSEGLTEASGRFTLEALSGDTQYEGYFPEGGYYGYLQHRFRVYPPLDEGGNGIFVAFSFYDDVELPPLQRWDSGLAVGPGPSLTFAPTPPAPRTPPSATVPEIMQGNEEPVLVPPSTPEPVVQLHGGDGLVWQQEHAASPWALSPYVLEDFGGVEAQVRAVSVGQWYFEPLAAEGSTLTFRQEWRSPRVPLPAGTLRPVSRGMPCSPAPVDRPCPYTDGKLEAVLTRPEGEQGDDLGVEALTFSLNTPARLRRVVVRNLEGTLGYQGRIRLVLEGSVDGGEWAPLGSFTVVNFDRDDPTRYIYQFSLLDTDTDSPFDGPMELYTPHVFLDAPLTGELPVRHVRLRMTSEEGSLTGLLWRLGEVSLFE
ncbi:hypothetical protein [Pyxidicoccus sp. MSG2]|uniref:hypothetical protein n=1 Tax=Pyxidicoccus sp. MSG2 TaxID=2996790 RepID=UPI00226DCEE1|nr:hypothetical protein [Pyxidicoccus sp. MSG2]MCY1018755.1 hypothetical protein [Pyxidicoccus sp. MSG2]